MQYRVNENDFIESLSNYYDSEGAESWEGFYDIDATKDNLHNFKRFQLALKKNQQGFDLIFINDRYKKYWSQGDVYASSNQTFCAKKNIELVTFHDIKNDKGERLEQALHHLYWEDNSFTIFKEPYSDHYMKVSALDWSDTVAFEEIKYREPSSKDLEAISFEVQSGVELMFWLSKIENETLTLDVTLHALEKSFTALQKTQLPLAEYHSVTQISFILTFLFAEQVRHEFGWRWVDVEYSKSPYIDGGGA